VDEKNWIFYHTPEIRSISYPNEKLFIAVGDSGLILRTTDKGETWEKRYIDTSSRLGILMYDDKFGILGKAFFDYSKDPITYITNDGGDTWIKDSRPENVTYSGNFINKNLIIGIGSVRNDSNKWKKKLIKVYNNWESWDSLSCPDLAYSFFISETKGWVYGGLKYTIDEPSRQLIYFTEDGGKTWTKQRDTIYNGWGLNSLKFFDENFGIAGSGFYHVCITTNGGKTWLDEEIDYRPPTSGKANYIKSINIPSKDIAFLLEDDNVYKYTRKITGVEDNEKNKDIFSISPNPAGEYIEISNLNKGLQPLVIEQEIKIFNLLGECVLSTGGAGGTHPFVPSQEGKIRIDVSSLPAGLYFVRVGNWMGRFVKI
jgi:hypothetical protein